MNLKRFFKRNMFFILFMSLVFIGIVYYNYNVEGFQYNYNSRFVEQIGDKIYKVKCTFDYCSGDFEVVNDGSGNPTCYKKCGAIETGSTTASNNPLFCKRRSGGTFSRNFLQFKKQNKNNNSQCELQCDAVYNFVNGKCEARVLTGTTTEYKSWRGEQNTTYPVKIHDPVRADAIRKGDKFFACPIFIGESPIGQQRFRASPKLVGNEYKCYADELLIRSFKDV